MAVALAASPLTLSKLPLPTTSSSSHYSPSPLQRQRQRQVKRTTMTKPLFSKYSNPEPEDHNTRAFSSPEDLRYLWKLGAGSVVGAVVIKYGSILFPAITRPNIVWALVLISTPVLVSAVILTKHSSVGDRSKDPL
ncbi:hypothetical protein IFM89_025459 [Coptis chinensis]|uniref:Uncharacterized protein n=1 Tax=Coptis chinensis TaxID=261450 RepID=A0A835MFY2_9MAGN|nr:hypothetical protein IFM89_025459 [Coptis chinensis]